MSGRLTLLVVGAALVTAAPTSRAIAPVAVEIRPRVTFSGGDVRTVVRTPRDRGNRALRIAIEAPSYYASSDRQMDGDTAPEIHEFRWKALPQGPYRVLATLTRAGDREAQAVGCFTVVEATHDRADSSGHPRATAAECQ